jgi:hypothetical protein
VRQELATRLQEHHDELRVQGYTVRRSVRVSGRTQRNGLLYRGCNRSCKSTGSVPKTADKLEIKAGVVEGTVYDAKGMAAIANIPSRDVLISKLLGSLQSPITNFARVMNQLAEKGGAAACEAAPTAE